MNSLAVGIDFGTSKTCIAAIKRNNLEVLTFIKHSDVIHNYKNNELFATNQIESSMGNTTYDIRQLLGCGINDEVVSKHNWPFHIRVSNGNGKLEIGMVHGHEISYLSPERLTSVLIKNAIEQNQLSQLTGRLAITMPAHFNKNQIEAFKKAISLAKLKEVEFLNEPEACVLAYDLHKQVDEKYVLIFNMTRESIDVAVAISGKGKVELKSTSGHFMGENCYERVDEDILSAIMTHVNKALIEVQLQKSDIEFVIMVVESTREQQIHRLLESYFEGKTFFRSIDYNDIVAIGAAIRANIVSEQTCKSLVELVPLSLGIKTNGYAMTTVITKNMPYPTTKQIKIDFTDLNNGVLEIYEGEHPLTKFNRRIATLSLGDPQLGLMDLQIKFTIDSENQLIVSAFDENSNVKFGTFITAFKRSTEYVTKVLKNAEKNKDNDKIIREKINARDYLIRDCLEFKNFITRYRRIEWSKDCAEKISKVQKIVLRICDVTIEWANELGLRELQEYAKKQKTLEEAKNYHQRMVMHNAMANCENEQKCHDNNFS